MTLRRTILVIGLVLLAGLLGWISTTPLSGTGQLVLLGLAAFSLIAAAILFVRRGLGSVLALLVGAGGGLMGGLLAGLSALGSSPAPLEIIATFSVGAGVALVALIDLVSLALARRPSQP